MNDALSNRSVPVYGATCPPVPRADYTSGAILLIDKPAHWTSFDVVGFLRPRLGIKKIGHAGTLDPLATGLLVLCCGKATKLIHHLQDDHKTYELTASFGASTPSQDAATSPDQTAPYDHVTEDSIRTICLQRFTGTIMQVPPMYSALKVGGRRLYTLARKGKTIEREPRQIEIYDIHVQSYNQGTLVMQVTCSKGTYVRTLVHDLALALGSRAHLTALRRTRSGRFEIKQAIDIDTLRTLFDNNTSDPAEGR